MPTRTTTVFECTQCYSEIQHFPSRNVEIHTKIPNENNNIMSKNNHDTAPLPIIIKKIKNNTRLIIGILIVCFLLIIGVIGLIIGLAFGLGEI